MASATESRITTERPTMVLALALAASAIVYAGTLVCIDADGYLVDGSDTAGLRFAGVATADQDNTDGADGAVSVPVYRESSFAFASTGLVATDVGRRVYLIDNQTVGVLTHASVDARIYVGHITTVVSATKCFVAIDPGDGLEVLGVHSVTIGASTAAAGSATGDAGVLPAGTAAVYPVTAADGTKGVRLHASDTVTGRRIEVANLAAAVLKVYPPTGGSINGAAANAAYSSASGKSVHLTCVDATANSWSASG